MPERRVFTGYVEFKIHDHVLHSAVDVIHVAFSDIVNLSPTTHGSKLTGKIEFCVCSKTIRPILPFEVIGSPVVRINEFIER